MQRHTLHQQRWQDRPSARSLLLTVLGEYVYAAGRPVWTRTFVEALGALGVEEPAARQALARSGTAGWLVSQRRGRETRWHLTDTTRAILAAGTERIYGFGRGKASWSGEWLMLYTNGAAADRRIRERLRTRLSWAGFGCLEQHLWISPDKSREEAAAEIFEALGLASSATSLRAVPGTIGNMEEMVAKAWDLGAIAEHHERFLDETRARRPTTPEASFVALTRLVHRWRSLPFVDPDLPDALLPSKWIGRRAARRFQELHDRWSAAAQKWWKAKSGA